MASNTGKTKTGRCCRHISSLSVQRIVTGVITKMASFDELVSNTSPKSEVIDKVDQNWLCMTCLKIGDSKKMKQHGRKEKHCILYTYSEYLPFHCLLCALDISLEDELLPAKIRELLQSIYQATLGLVSRFQTPIISSLDGVQTSILKNTKFVVKDKNISDENIRVQRPIGLVNLGNTCFMNACLQALASITCIPNFYRPSIEEGPLSNSLFSLLQTLQLPQIHDEDDGNTKRRCNRKITNYISPRHFLDTLAERYDFIGDGGQQDSHDFMRLLFNALDDEVPTPRVKGSHQKLFEGTIKIGVCCRKCRRMSAHNESMMDLSLAIRRPSFSLKDRMATINYGISRMSLADSFNGDDFQIDIVNDFEDEFSPEHKVNHHTSAKRKTQTSAKIISLQDMLDAYCEMQVLDGDDAFECEICKKSGKTSATVTNSLCSPLPPCIVFHIQRFSTISSSSKSMFKSCTKKYRRQRHNSFSYQKDHQPVDLPLEIDMNCYLGDRKTVLENNIYTLVSLVIHEGGSPDSGHYTAIVKRGMANWFHISDTSVTALKIGPTGSHNAYMAIYERRNPS